jgi:hypothetical protein
VWDLDAGITETTPQNTTGPNHYQLIARVRVSDGVTLSSTQHSQVDNEQNAQWDVNAGTANDEVYNGGTPSIANGKYALGTTTHGVAFDSSQILLAASSSGGSLSPPINSQDDPPGWYVQDLDLEVKPDYWVVGGTTTGINGPEGYSPTCVLNDDGELWWSVTPRGHVVGTEEWERGDTAYTSRLDLDPTNALHLVKVDAAGDVLWQRHSTQSSSVNHITYGATLSPDGVNIYTLSMVGASTDIIVNDGEGDSETLTDITGAATCIVISRVAATGALNWAKKIRTFSGASGNTGSGGNIFPTKNLTFNAISNTLRFGLVVDFTNGINRLIAGAGAGVGDVVYTNDTVGGDLEERFVDIVIDIDTGTATSIGQILESTDLGVVSADTFCDLRAG